MHTSKALHLSEIQLVLIRMIIEGKKDEEIAINLGETKSNIKAMVEEMLEELGLSSRVELAVYATQKGWI